VVQTLQEQLLPEEGRTLLLQRQELLLLQLQLQLQQQD